MEENKSDFISVKMLAKYLNVSKMKIYDLMKNDKLPYYYLGKRYSFKLNEIEKFLISKKIQ